MDKSVKSTKTINCKKFRKNKPPKCNDQEGCDWVPIKGCLKETSRDKSIISPKSLKKDIKPLKEVNSLKDEILFQKNINKFKEFLEKVHSISGISDYGRIDLTTGPILLNFGDYHTWSKTKRDALEKDENKWKQLCDEDNNKQKQIIYYHNLKNKFYTTNLRNFQELNLNLLSILKNNEIFISYLILHVLQKFKNVHLFLELWKSKVEAIYTGRHATPMLFNKALLYMSRSKPQFMKDNNNYIHYNDFRDKKYIFFNIFKKLLDNKYRIDGPNPLRNTAKEFIQNDNEWLIIIKKIYILSFLQGYKSFKGIYRKTQWMEEVNSYIDYGNKDTFVIFKNNIGIYRYDANKLLNEMKKISGRYKSISTINIDGKTIHCTRISKQLLKLKPEIQDKLVKWFYDLIISKFNNIIIFKKDNNIFEIKYIFWIMYIDFYNLCRILYYSGFNNDNKDMSKNIILNYGGENMYLKKPSKYLYHIIYDNNTGGHASSILLFFRKYLYGSGRGNNYIEKPTNNSIQQKRHYSFKNDDIEIKKYLSRYIDNRQEGRECVEIK